MNRKEKLVRTYKIGRFEVEFSSPPIVHGGLTHMHCAWSPAVPEQLTLQELARYYEVMAEFQLLLKKASGMNGPSLVVQV